ncbi:hypothetical protein JA9_002295 [Meyerozyma sp. JA9]|nr:hypothetical protein JA9_002295 [Meyerozyma sp. JA9]
MASPDSFTRRILAEELQPRKSLLSSSLAGESGHPQASQSLNIDSAMLTDEHPEPELLASSVGKEMDGRIIPSSSTISLLSLNQDPEGSNQQVGVSAPQPNSNRVSPQVFQNAQMQPIKPAPITSRNSVTRLNQHRFQTYRSPPPTANATLHSQLAGQAAAIPIREVVPDSPMLDPTSIGGSPSRFWLSSQTPPRSLAGSYKNKSYQLQMSQMHGTVGGREPIYVAKGGGSSPILYPVQTPSEDPPMTPLYLNGDDYFAQVRIPEQEEMEEEDEAEKDIAERQ